MLKEEKMVLVRQVMSNHPTLPNRLFDPTEKVYPEVRDKLLQISNYILELFLPMFPKIEIKDIVIIGSMCSYIYHDLSDLDLFIVVDNIGPNNEGLKATFFNNLNYFIHDLTININFYTHPVDCGILLSSSPIISGYRYSLLTNHWLCKPEYREFSFTPEDLFASYCKFSAGFHKYVENLPKINNAFLTYESARQLQKYIDEIHYKMMAIKDTSSEKEYALDYNIYRLFKRFGVYAHFQQYAVESLKNAAR